MFGNPYYAPYQIPYYTQNNDFKTPYQQNAQVNQQPQTTPQMPNFAPKNDMIWVLNKNEADSYPVAPNCSVVLWDKNSPTIYIKSMSASGVPSMRTLDFTERIENTQNQPAVAQTIPDGKFVTVEQFDDLRADFNALKDKYNELLEMQAKKETKVPEKTTTSTKKSKGGDE